MKAFIYGRYSSHNQKDASIEQQFADIREYCEKNGITIIGEYADRAISGKTDKRAEFQSMIKDATKGKVQLIVCWKVDRFARNREDAAVYKGRLRRHDVRVIYAREPIPEGSAGILLEGMLESTAEWYSATLSENIKRGMYDNARACKVNNGTYPLGYTKGKDGCFAIEPVGAAIVREVYSLYAEGLIPAHIINGLNARNLRTSRGEKFNKNSLRTILQNERYTGVYIYGDVRVEDGMPQIITRELFDKVQNQIGKTRKSPAATRTGADYILTGKLFCGHCGGNMVGESGAGKSGKKYNYYICACRKRGGSCDKKTVRKDWLEREVARISVERVLVDDMIELIATEAVAVQEYERKNSPVKQLKSELATVKKGLRNMLAAIEQGIITPTTKERMEALEAQKEELEETIAYESIAKPVMTKEQIIFWLEKFRDGDIEDEKYQQRIIEMFVNAVYLYDGEIRIAYNYCGKSDTVTKELVEGVDKPPEAGICSDGVSCTPPNVSLVEHPEKEFSMTARSDCSISG